jgi:hypothetical protein
MLINALAEIVPHPVGCLFTLVIVCFGVQKLFDLIQSHLSILVLYGSTIQRVVTYACILKCFPAVVSKFHVLQDGL